MTLAARHGKAVLEKRGLNGSSLGSHERDHLQPWGIVDGSIELRDRIH